MYRHCQDIKKSTDLIKRNWKAVTGFEILYHLLTFLLFTPLVYGIFHLSIRTSGISYLSMESWRQYGKHPLSILLLLLTISVFTSVALFNMLGMVACFHASYHNERITILQIVRAGALGSKAVWKKNSWPILLPVMLILPLAYMVTASGHLSVAEMPGFIMEYIFASPVLVTILIMMALLYCYMVFRWIFCVHIFILEGGGFRKVSFRTAALMRKRYLRTGLGLLVWYILAYLALAAIIILLSLFSILVIKIFIRESAAFAAALRAVWIISGIIFHLGSWFAVPVLFARISVMYYEYQKENGTEPAPFVKLERIPVRPAVWQAVRIILCASLLGNICVFAFAQYNKFEFARQIIHIPEVSAHRGSSLAAPENNIPAFQRAIEDGADWIELDVHQTKDGIIVVSHDDDLKRFAGVKKNIWEMTYDEIKQYDVGSWFSPEYKDLHLATLEEVLKLCKGRIKVNIELKPTGHEPDFEQHVIDLVLKYDYTDNCVLASLNAASLERAEELAPQIDTVYIMPFAAGNIMSIPYVDGYSIEYSFITQKLVETAKKHNKFIFAWTVNTRSHIENVKTMGVDNIITDDPVLALVTIYDTEINDSITKAVSLFFPSQRYMLDN